MTWEEWLGIKASAFVAGLAGGIIALTFEEKLSFVRAVILIFTGGTTAGYGYKAIEYWYGANDSLAGFFGFVAGLVSMKLVHILLDLAEAARKDPSILLSLDRILKLFKNGRNSSNTNGDDSVPSSDLHASGKSTTTRATKKKRDS